jgi:hypothetical protein
VYLGNDCSDVELENLDLALCVAGSTHVSESKEPLIWPRDRGGPVTSVARERSVPWAYPMTFFGAASSAFRFFESGN